MTRRPLRVGFGFEAGGLVPENLSVPAAAGRAVELHVGRDHARPSPPSPASSNPRSASSSQASSAISDVAHQTIEFGAREALTLLAVISLSLAIINLFPFLPLDGGHIFWSLVEKVRGRRVPFSVIERASAIGFLLDPDALRHRPDAMTSAG